MPPRISVVINAYNSERFLRETIKTVLNQTFCDFELLIIDDGSQDRSLSIAQEFTDQRIVILTYQNGGIAKSRNRGLQKASGEFVAFLDHDDLWHPEKLEAQYALLAANPQAGFAYSWIDTMDENGEPIRKLSPANHSGNIYTKLLVKNFIHTASNPLMRTSYLQAVGGFDENIYGADDWDLFIRLAARHQALCDPFYRIQYRIVKGSGAAQSKKFKEGCLQVITKAFNEAPSDLQTHKDKALGLVYQYLCFRTLEELPTRKSVPESWQYLKASRKHQTSLWKKKTLLKVLFKMSIALALPLPIARELLGLSTQAFRFFEKKSQ